MQRCAAGVPLALPGNRPGMPDDLVSSEGVDEGSAASSTEGDAGPDPDADLVGEPPHGAPLSEADAAPPLPPNDQDLGPGQQLAAGEG